MLLLVIVACFVVLFFYAFVQYFSTWPKGCLRAGRSRESLFGLASRFGRFLYPARRDGAHLIQAAFENSIVFWDCCEQPLRAAIPVGPGALLTPARGGAAPM